MEYHILIVEDDDVLNKGITYCLKEEGYNIVSVYTALDAFELVKNNIFDLIILDVNLPDESGFELCKKIKRLKEIPIFFLTAKDLEKDILKGFDLGAEDYITKPFSINVLKKKMLVCLKYHNKIIETIYKTKDLKIDFDKREIHKKEERLNITPTEYKIIEIFVKFKNKVLTKEQFIENLWDYNNDFIDEHALSVYISRLRAKIEDKENHFIKTIYGMGYMWIDE